MIKPWLLRLAAKHHPDHLTDAKISTVIERMKIAVFWKAQFDEVEVLIREHGAGVIGGTDFDRYKLMKDFALHVGDILGLVMNTLQEQTFKHPDSAVLDPPFCMGGSENDVAASIL